jgi:hypothetical protein
VHVLVTSILKGTSSGPFVVPDDKETVRKILVKLANRIQELEKEKDLDSYDEWISGLQNLSAPKESSFVKDVNSKDDLENKSKSLESVEFEDLSNDFAGFSIGAPSDTHFGESSNIMLMKAAMDHQRELTGPGLPDWGSIFAHVKRPELWNRDIVSLYCIGVLSLADSRVLVSQNFGIPYLRKNLLYTSFLILMSFISSSMFISLSGMYTRPFYIDLHLKSRFMRDSIIMTPLLGPLFLEFVLMALDSSHHVTRKMQENVGLDKFDCMNLYLIRR